MTSSKQTRIVAIVHPPEVGTAKYTEDGIWINQPWRKSTQTTQSARRPCKATCFTICYHVGNYPLFPGYEPVLRFMREVQRSVGSQGGAEVTGTFSSGR